jgi:hypothetical protein
MGIPSSHIESSKNLGQAVALKKLVLESAIGVFTSICLRIVSGLAAGEAGHGACPDKRADDLN